MNISDAKSNGYIFTGIVDHYKEKINNKLKDTIIKYPKARFIIVTDPLKTPYMEIVSTTPIIYHSYQTIEDNKKLLKKLAAEKLEHDNKSLELAQKLNYVFNELNEAKRILDNE